MSVRRRKPNDDTMALALASGKSVAAAARQCGVCERTVYRRLADPVFQKQLAAVRADMVIRTADQLTAAGLAAVRTLLDLLKADMLPGERLGAAKTVLEAGVRLREGDPDLSDNGSRAIVVILDDTDTSGIDTPFPTEDDAPDDGPPPGESD
jgi:transposase-like protein